MPRVFEKTVDYPEVDVPDWDLISRLNQVFLENILEGTEFTFKLNFEAHDNRGTYRNNELTAFRAEVEAQDDPPERITLSLRCETEDQYRSFLVWLSSVDSHGLKAGHFESTDEPVVTHLASRTEDLFNRAAERRRIRIEREAAAAAPPQIPAAVIHSAAPTLGQSWWDRWGVPLLIGIAVTVVGGLIVAAISGAF